MGKNITPVVLAVIKKEGKYLLTKRVEPDDVDTQLEFNGLWQLPGGGLEFGESVEEGTVREAWEELRVKVRIEYMIPKLYYRIYKDRWHGLLIAFVCSLVSPESEIQLNHEASEWKWCSYEEVKKLTAFPLVKEIIGKVELDKD